jgi:hypothetical protein
MYFSFYFREKKMCPAFFLGIAYPSYRHTNCYRDDRLSKGIPLLGYLRDAWLERVPDALLGMSDASLGHSCMGVPYATMPYEKPRYCLMVAGDSFTPQLNTLLFSHIHRLLV